MQESPKDFQRYTAPIEEIIPPKYVARFISTDYSQHIESPRTLAVVDCRPDFYEEWD